MKLLISCRRYIQALMLLVAIYSQPVLTAQCSLLCNTDFENQQVTNSVAILDASHVPCWNTTAPDNNIEVWHTGFNGVPSYSGLQFIELNAYYVSTLYQNFTATPGTAISVSFAHRGRAGTDTMSVSIGPVGGPYIVLGKFGDGNVAWGYYTVNYTIPAGVPTNYSIRFNSIYATGGNQAIGNFLDAISVSLSNTYTVSMTATNVPCGGPANGGSASVAGCSTCTYTWLPTGGNQASATGLTAGNYTVNMTNSSGCPNSSTVNITQGSSASFSLATQNVTCNGLANGTASLGNCSTCTYTWSNGANTGNVSGLGPGTYSVTAQAGPGGCPYTTTFTISEPPALTASSTVTNGLCGSSGSATVTASGGTGTLSYTWSPSGGNSASASGLSGGTYTTLVMDAAGCTKTVTSNIIINSTYTVSISSASIACYGGNTGSAAATVNGGTGPITYNWTVNNTGAGATPAISGLYAGVYSVTITDGLGCVTTRTVAVAEPAAILVNMPSIKICDGQQATITPIVSGGTPPYTYQWLPSNAGTPSIIVSPTLTSFYTLNITDSQHCPTVTSVASVGVWPPLSISISGPTLVCKGSAASLTATASGGNGNYQYTWQPGNITGSQYHQVMNSNGQYSVTVTDGCTIASPQATVSVSVLPVLTPSPGISVSQGCPPLCVTVYDSTLIGAGVLLWHWSFSNGNASNAVSPTVCFQQSGNYTGTLTITSSNGCTSSYSGASISVTVHPQPHAAMSSNFYETTLSAPDFVLTNSSTNYSSAYWTMEPATYTTTGFSYSATQEGAYPVTLTVINQYGCRDSLTQLLLVKPEFTFYAPNAFTPNADGRNDSFLPMGTGWKNNTYELMIFDRWGEQIFSTSDIYKGWNGRLKNNDPVKQDVYVWKVELDDMFSRHHSYTGSVLVLH